MLGSYFGEMCTALPLIFSHCFSSWRTAWCSVNSASDWTACQHSRELLSYRLSLAFCRTTTTRRCTSNLVAVSLPKAACCLQAARSWRLVQQTCSLRRITCSLQALHLAWGISCGHLVLLHRMSGVHSFCISSCTYGAVLD